MHKRKPFGALNLCQIVRRRTITDHLIGGSVDERAVEHAVAHARRRDPAALQICHREDVVVVDRLLGY